MEFIWGILLLFVLIILFIYAIEHEYTLPFVTSGVNFIRSDMGKFLMVMLTPVLLALYRSIPSLKTIIENNTNYFSPKNYLFDLASMVLPVIITALVMNKARNLYIKWKFRIGIYFLYYLLYFIFLTITFFQLCIRLRIDGGVKTIYNSFIIILLDIVIGFGCCFFLNTMKMGLLKKVLRKMSLNKFGLHTLFVSLFSSYFFILIFGTYTRYIPNVKIAEIIIYTLFYVMGVFTFLNCPYFKKFNKKIKVTFLNLDMFDIISNNFYYEYWNINQPKTGRFFKINFHEVFPQGAENTEVNILNHNLNIINQDNDSTNSYCYFYVEDFDETYSVLLKCQLSYRIKGKKHNEIMDVCFKFRHYQREIICEKYLILNYYQSRWKRNRLKKKCELKEPLYYLMNYMYQYGCDIENLDENFETANYSDDRKWLKHTGDFGSGKSALDILTIANQGYTPVVISPWEENYDNDLLYLVFDHLIQYEDKKRFMLTRSVIFFFLASMIAVATLLKSMFLFLWDTVDNLNIVRMIPADLSKWMISEFYDNLDLATLITLSDHTDTIYRLIAWIISIVIAFLFTSYLLPTIIIHVKDSTKVHQSYYLKAISHILLKDKVKLVIEDIDRFDEEKVEMIYRLASSINQACYMAKKPIGILSYQMDHILNQNKDRTYDEHEEKLVKERLEQLENKVICNEYMKDYKDYEKQEAKKQYFLECLYVMLASSLAITDWNRESVMTEIEKKYPFTVKILLTLEIDLHNFRAIRKDLATIYELITRKYEDQDQCDKAIADQAIAKYIAENVY